MLPKAPEVVVKPKIRVKNPAPPNVICEPTIQAPNVIIRNKNEGANIVVRNKVEQGVRRFVKIIKEKLKPKYREKKESKTE